MDLRASRRKGVCSDEDAHGRKQIGHADEGVVRREVERVPTESRTGAISHVGVKGSLLHNRSLQMGRKDRAESSS